MAEVSLRRFELSDLDYYWEWASDERVAATCSWDAYTSKDDLRRYMEEAVLPSPWYRAIVVGGRPVGEVFMKLPESAAGKSFRGELGYVLATAWQGKGLATAAVRAAMEAVMKEVEGIERVEALVFVENMASQRVLEKVGFLKEGVLRRYWFKKGTMRDMIIYSFTKGDTFLI